jgi:hypothetical protein
MDRAAADHYDRVKSSVMSSHSLRTAATWITENTFLKGEPYSYLDHEFQEVIVSDPSREKNVRKCSQIGISELFARVGLALANILDSSTTIYTLPTADFAKNFVKTRIDPTVQTSPKLKAALNSTADNMQIKQFGTSFIYYKGTIGQSAAISVPADVLMHDEWDFSDLQIASNYESRLTHSKHKLKYKFSTPTVGAFGISAEMDVSRRFFNMAKCGHCNEWFLPSYFQHVHIPGFSGEKKEISRDRLPHLRWQEAKVLCPGCGLEPDLGPEHRTWVCENPDENFEPAGYQIQPFDAPRIISAADLVLTSTKYDRFVDFVNFGLGLPAEDKETSLGKEEIDRCYEAGHAGMVGFFVNVMGIDLGLQCHIVVSGVDPYGRMLTRHTEVVPLARLFERRVELAKQFRVSLTVCDSQPYADILMRMQAQDANLYGAVYVRSANLAVYSIKKLEGEDEAGEDEKSVDAGEERERQVNVNRNRAFDGFMEFVRGGNWLIVPDENRETVTKHLQDMKRIKQFTADKEIAYVWQKSAKGQDHFHHALLYCWIASKMRAVGSSAILLPGILGKFHVEH